MSSTHQHPRAYRPHALAPNAATIRVLLVSADAIAEGVPVVGSEAIDWLPQPWKAHADEPRDIARVAEHLLRSTDTADQGRTALQRYTAAGVQQWMRFLGG